MRKHRPYTGLLLLASAVAVVLAPQCGLLGHVVSEGLRLLVGATGTVLFTITLGLAGLACLIPHGTTRRAIRELLKRRARTCATCRTVRAPAARQITVTPAKVLPLRSVPPAPPRPVHDDVRAGLKSLGYVYAEIDAVLPQLDRTQSLPDQLRAALKLMRKVA